MNVILYFFDYATMYGGAVNTLLQQMLLMKEKGYAVHGFVSGYLGNLPNEDYSRVFKDSGVELESIIYPVCSHTEDIDIVKVLECYEEIKQVIEKYKPVLMHSVQINPAVELASRELGIPHIMDIYQAHPDFFAISYTNIFPQYHICDSLYYAKAWREGLGIHSYCVRTVAESYVHKRTAQTKKTLKFVCVGQISPRKNQLEVIKGFRKALQKGVVGTLELYGNDGGIFADKCRQYIREQSLEEQVKICGFCTNREEIYAEADVLICGSKIESYPNVISESLANGVIVVSTPVAGVPEVIKNGENGYLCEGYSSDDIEKGIEKVAKAFSSGAIENILQKAEETFLHTHAAEQVAKETEGVYRQVIRKGVPSRLPGIKEVQTRLAAVLGRYYSHEEEFTRPEFVRKKLWYLFHIDIIIQKQLQEGKKIYIWGAGKIGSCILEINLLLELNWKFAGFLDREKTGTYLNYVVSRPEEIYNNENSVVLIAFINGAGEAMQELKEAKRIYGKDYFLMVPRTW